jgi:poly[(R)-3-hydroxyalkanoate] polymerase subunit PhaC
MAIKTKPHQRLGPRPLPIHLMAANAYYMSLIAASLTLKGESIVWSPNLKLRARELMGRLEALAPHPQKKPNQKKPPPENQPQKKSTRKSQHADAEALRQEPSIDVLFTQAVEAEARQRLGAMLKGINAYRHHPYHRSASEPDILWREGTSQLLDYRRFRTESKNNRPVLLIPSLVNRAYIMDLQQDHSFARHLAQAGHSVFLLDWNAPGAIEQTFDLGDYIARTRRAIDACAAQCGTPIAAIGYCMGGILALAASLGIQDRVDALILMATPWDFHAERPDQAKALAALLPGLEPGMTQSGELAVDVLQALFAGLDPMLAVRKFITFAHHDTNSTAARSFVALEDWLNDGVALAAPVARDCIAGWYGRNATAQGTWRVDGLPCDPSQWSKPTLALIPAADRIVPPASARALAATLPRCLELTPPVGHIGMMTARNARAAVWDPVLEFLSDPEGSMPL